MYHKIAIALAPRHYKQFLKKREGRFLKHPSLSTQTVPTHDDNYTIIAGEIEEPENLTAWADLLRLLEKKRHSVIVISEDGGVWTDVETDDDEGCDEVFSEILGWSAHICLWQDVDQKIV